MLTRPTPQTVGLTEAALESLRNKHDHRRKWRERIVSWGTLVIIICSALWLLFPSTSGADFLARLLVAGFASLFSWVFVCAVLYGGASIFLRNPKQYHKVEAYDKAIVTFRNDWRQYYWKSFWDSVARLPYHIEAPNEYPKERLGFSEHWGLCDGHLFLIMYAKRSVMHIVPEGTAQFEKFDAMKVSNARSFYHADVMCIASPNGFTQEAIDYLVKDGPKQFLFHAGKNATDLINAIKTNTFTPVLQNAFRTAQDSSQSDVDAGFQSAKEIVSEYGKVLEHLGDPGVMLYPESRLPYPKCQIRWAIELLLLMPNDEPKRNALEVGNIFLDGFVSAEDYAIVHQQRGGLSEALKKSSEGKMDAMDLARFIVQKTTQDGEARLHAIQQRVKGENEFTLKRHRELRQEASRFHTKSTIPS